MSERRTAWLVGRRGDGQGSLLAAERAASSNGARLLRWDCHGDALRMSVPDRWCAPAHDSSRAPLGSTASKTHSCKIN